MGYIREKSGEQRKRYKRFLVISILLSIIILQMSVTVCFSTALAAPHVNCVNPMPPNDGTSAPPASAVAGIVVINEVLTSPRSLWNCTDPGPSLGSAWVEIYNPQNQPLDLSASHASLNEGQHSPEYSLRFGSIIAAHSFLVIFPFAVFIPPYSPIRLVIGQVVIDQVSIPSLAPDTSYARIPDGSNNWQITTSPTIASSNTLNSTTSSNQTTKTGKTKSVTSTPIHTTKPKSTNTQSSGSSNDGTSTDESAASTGVQPTWTALRLPRLESNNPMTNNTAQDESSTSSTSLTTASDFSLLLNKILLTLLTTTFVFVVLGCWWLYKRDKSIRP